MYTRHAVQSDALRAFYQPSRQLLERSCASSRAAKPRVKMQRQATSSERNNGKPILVIDIMDTLIRDPFYTEMPLFFDLKFLDLLNEKDPKTWIRFERGEISEEQMFQEFFKDRRPFNGTALVQRMVSGYSWVDGMEILLIELARQGVEMHAMSNYPSWYKRIDAKLAVSRFLPWTFVSCEGPMKGLRKPDPQAYKVVSDTLGVAPEQLLLIDDRQANVVAALESGWGALLFNNAGALRRDLEKKRIMDGTRRIVPG